MLLGQGVVIGQKFPKKHLVKQVKIPPTFLDFFSNPVSSYSITPLSGGANNTLHKVESESQTFVLKKYRLLSGGHDRFLHEEKFYHWIQDQNIRNTPKVYAWDKESRQGLFSFIKGSFPSEPISDDQIKQLSDFILRLNVNREHAHKLEIPMATDTALSIAGHLENVGGRLSKLKERVDHSDKLKPIRDFLNEELLPRWEFIYKSSLSSDLIDFKISKSDQVLSPSDIGFHNTLQSSKNKLSFFDFEYAGWDDPCKMCCDFLLQPRYAISSDQSIFFENEVSSLLSSQAQEIFPHRLQLLKPIHCIKWCCIFFNELTNEGFEDKQSRLAKDRLLFDDMDQQIVKAKQYLSLSFK